MRKFPSHFALRCFATSLILALPLVCAVNARAGNAPVPLWLFDLGNNNDGNTPLSAPIFDEAGNLYATAQKGGPAGVGVVFKLSPTSSGLWKETVLYTFKDSPDGSTPDSTLVRDSAGNLYGTTLYGGLNPQTPQCSRGCGIVFKLTPTAKGPWKETVLHHFTGGPDGANPFDGLVQDKAGNFYGTTSGGGPVGLGVAFKLSHTTTGWKETVLHGFGIESDAAAPASSLVFDGAGNLYGTSFFGGAQNLGTVFKLTPQPSGSWTSTVLHSFLGGADGLEPIAPVVLDKVGNVYGASQQLGNILPCGTVFKLTAANGYAETILHTFRGTFHGGDGCYANGLAFDSKGNLFATASSGGTDNAGIIFKLTQTTLTSTGWRFSILHNFIGDQIGSTDGELPLAPMTFGPGGALFGTTIGPGFPAGGEVFKFVP
jgi:uncharacterized repeat protein (TIGR03803 family)